MQCLALGRVGVMLRRVARSGVLGARLRGELALLALRQPAAPDTEIPLVVAKAYSRHCQTS
jgi:hypothetical protein